MGTLLVMNITSPYITYPRANNMNISDATLEGFVETGVNDGIGMYLKKSSKIKSRDSED